ncbi:MAG: Co2+/Mg2+ efflux protein ApaG [Parvularculaceae bacterium]
MTEAKIRSARAKPARRHLEDMRYERVTNGIRVSVSPAYLAKESDPSDDLYVWSYTVKIDNQSNDRVQLIRRHWLITDAKGMTEEVKGVGVVGEQPVIAPGEQFEYTSGAPLSTPSGMMVGRYLMETAEGDAFEVDIPAFSLDSPHERRLVH